MQASEILLDGEAEYNEESVVNSHRLGCEDTLISVIKSVPQSLSHKVCFLKQHPVLALWDIFFQPVFLYRIFIHVKNNETSDNNTMVL